MNDWITSNEVIIRFGVFIGVFSLMGIWEVIDARRALTASKGSRWFANLALVALDSVILRLLLPAAAVGTALAAEKFGWGLFHRVNLPYWFAVVVSVILLDLTIYLQHVMFHAVPALWRFHTVHHADVDFDVTTGIRFHPVEMILSMFIKMGVISILGPPVLAVIIFESVLNATSMFNHANVFIPERLERLLRWIIVTPDMHRVHHSVDDAEYSSNFGFSLPWWDRLLGTYVEQPARGHKGMAVGLQNFREPEWQTLPRILAMPFVKRAASGARCGRSPK